VLDGFWIGGRVLKGLVTVFNCLEKKEDYIWEYRMCEDFDCGWGCVFMNNGHSGSILFVSVVS